MLSVPLISWHPALSLAGRSCWMEVVPLLQLQLGQVWSLSQYQVVQRNQVLKVTTSLFLEKEDRLVMAVEQL